MPAALDAIKPVKRETLQAAVYTQLCDLILEGNLAPGESITVASIAEAFNVSPMPVREAISRLTASGALTVVSGRSIGVPHLDEETATDLRNVRLEIEPLSLQWAIERRTPEFLSELRDTLTAMEKAEGASQSQAFLRSNYNFHFTIYRQAGSKILLDTIQRLWLRINPHFHRLHQLGHYRISNDQHRDIVRGIETGDVDLATSSLKDDINTAFESLAKTES